MGNECTGDSFDTDEMPPIDYEVKVSEGTAVAFDNEGLVHRVRMLKNKKGDDKPRYRSFLAFFIIDPTKPIRSTRDCPTLRKEDFVTTILKHTMIESEDVATLICDYGACGYTLSEAKALRKLNIECRKKPSTKGTAGAWGAYNFGNSGDRIWFENGKAYPQEHKYYDEVRWINTTQSELHTSDKSEK